MSAQRIWLAFVACVAAFIFTGCNSTSTSPSQSPPPTQRLYVTTDLPNPGGVAIFVYNLPLTSSSQAALTMLTTGYGVGNPCLDSAGHIFIPVEGVNGKPPSGPISAFALPLAPTSAAVFTLSAPDIPSDCHFDPAGNMYVANQSALPIGIQVFKAPVQSGSAINSTITASIVTPSGVWTDSSGAVYVSNGGNVLVYSSFATGNTLQATLGRKGFIVNSGLALGPTGSLYVLNGTALGEIDVYDPPFTDTSLRNQSKTITLAAPLFGNALTYLSFDKLGDMFVGVDLGCPFTGCVGNSHIYMLQPPYKSVNVDLDLGATSVIGLTVGG